MKAKIIGQKVSSGIMDYVHGGGSYMHRIFVSSAGNLVFGISEGNAFAFTGYDLEENKPDIITEIDVPDDLIAKALVFARAIEVLQNESTEIKALLALVKK